MNLLFFDTETTGLPRNYKAPVSDLGNWPRMVQIAWLLTDEHGNEAGAYEYVIKPDGYVIPAEAARIHGITTERALREGYPLADVLAAFLEDLRGADCLIAHNVQFDEKIVGAELLRAGLRDELQGRPKVCTMQSATDFCRLPGPYGFKWPTLAELHTALFGQGFIGAHRALADVRACAKSYFQLRRLQVLRP